MVRENFYQLNYRQSGKHDATLFRPFFAALRVQARKHGINAQNSKTFHELTSNAVKLCNEVKTGVKMVIDADIEHRMAKIKNGLCLQRTLELEYGIAHKRTLAEMVDEAAESRMFKLEAVQHMKRMVVQSNSGRHTKFDRKTLWQPKVLHPQSSSETVAEQNPSDANETTPPCIAMLPTGTDSAQTIDPWTSGDDPWSQGIAESRSNAMVNNDSAFNVTDPWMNWRTQTDQTSTVKAQESVESKDGNPATPRQKYGLHLDSLLPDTPNFLQKTIVGDDAHGGMLQELQARLNQVEVELASKSTELVEIRAHVDILSCQPRTGQRLQEDLVNEVANHPQIADMSENYVECVKLLMPQLPKSLDKQMVGILGTLYMKAQMAKIQFDEALETLQDEIDDLKADRLSAFEASRKQIETARLLQAQVDSKIQFKTNELQQRLLAQHVQHQAEISQFQAAMKSFEQVKSENKALQLVNEQLRKPDVMMSAREVQTDDSYMMEQFLSREKQKANPIVEQIGHLLRTHDIKLYARMPQLLEKYMGKEEMLLNDLCRKYLGNIHE